MSAGPAQIHSYSYVYARHAKVNTGAVATCIHLRSKTKYQRADNWLFAVVC